jgi:hypothetical protein
MAADVQAVSEAPPRARKPRPPVRRWVRRALNLVIVLAFVPAILVVVAKLGVTAELMSWNEGFGAFAAWLSPRLALASIATGLIGLVAAMMLDFDRMWWRPLLALSLSAATLAGYLWSRAPDAPPAEQAE